MKSNPAQINISRRDFLKESLLGLVGLALPWGSQASGVLPENLQETQATLGRVLKPQIWVYSAPRFSSRMISQAGINSILPIIQTLQGQADPFGNGVWFQIASSLYIHSSSVQIVENKLNPVVTQISPRAKLAQITVPYAQAWKDSFSKPKTSIFLFYGSTHWVSATVQDNDGSTYYKVEEDRWKGIYFVHAENLHIFSDEELNPISTTIPAAEKRIEVLLNDRMVVAYEKDRPVFSSPMSSGLVGESKNYSTPPGNYEIINKRPSRHMTHSDRIGDGEADMYGVPWVAYFTNTGIAFHGTYWHNEFTYPHSHGCINLPIESAKWIYLWSNPVVPPSEHIYRSSHGTPVKVS